jgi:alcohol dehydrogenase class IV
VTRDALEALVAIAVADSCHQNNPRPVGAADFREIFTRALE